MMAWGGAGMPVDKKNTSLFCPAVTFSPPSIVCVGERAAWRIHIQTIGKVMLAKDRISFATHAKVPFGLFAKVEQHLATQDIDDLLRHLIKLRVSQINGCTFCIDMHTREARADGEDQKRLDMLVGWRDMDVYTDGEKAALAWAEALTVPGNGQNLDTLYAALREHYSEEDIATLCSIIVMINAWNRLGIAAHNTSF